MTRPLCAAVNVVVVVVVFCVVGCDRDDVAFGKDCDGAGDCGDGYACAGGTCVPDDVGGDEGEGEGVAGETCDNPIALELVNGLVVERFDAGAATDDYASRCVVGENAPTRDLFFSFTTTAAASVVISVAPIAGDADFSLLDEGACAPDAAVECVRISLGGETETFPSLSAGVHVIAVEATGEFQLSVRPSGCPLGASPLGDDRCLRVVSGPRMSDKRTNHTATLLGSGDVLLYGGGENSGGALATAEIYRRGTNTLVPLPTGPDPLSPRRRHTATLIDDTHVLLAGGIDAGESPRDDATLLDAVDGTLSTFAIAEALVNHAAVQLDDGDVLLIGGVNAQGVTDHVQRLDPASQTSTFTTPLPAPRSFAQAFLEDSGDVLVVAGGAGDVTDRDVYRFDVDNAVWSTLFRLDQPHSFGVAFALDDGVYVVGGGTVDANNSTTAITFAGHRIAGATVPAPFDATFQRFGSGLTLGAIGLDVAPVTAFEPAQVFAFADEVEIGRAPLGRRIFSSAAVALDDNEVLISGGLDLDTKAVDEVAVIEITPKP